MTDRITIDVSGVEQTIRQIRSYSQQLADRVVTISVRGAANFVKKKIQAAAPVNKNPTANYPAGRLKRAIIVKKSKINTARKNGVISFIVRIREKGGKRHGNQKNAFYGRFVNDGWIPRGKRKRFVTGLKFFERVERETRGDVQRIISVSIKNNAESLARRLGL
jgi:HK97 gp10 family phage protein